MIKQTIILLACLLAGAMKPMAQTTKKPVTRITSKQAASNALSPGEHYASVNGLKLHYYVEGHGPVCLFPSPGWGASVDYARHMKPLVNHFTMVFYDTRLTGKSTGPDDYTKYSASYFTDDMDGLRQYLGQEKVWIAGHSGGGFQVLRYGIYFSNHLNGIIAIGAVASFDSLHLIETKRLIQLRLSNPYYTQERIDLYWGIDTVVRSLKEALAEVFGFYFHDLAKMKYFPTNVTFSDEVFGFTNRAGLFSENLLPQLHKITVPVLVIAGDDDIVCNVISQSVRIYQQLTKGSLAVINNSGHCPWIEQSQAFSIACEAWLKDIIQNPR